MTDPGAVRPGVAAGLVRTTRRSTSPWPGVSSAAPG